MPSTYKTPGVYIEEISKFPPSVAEVATAIPAFIGYTQQAIVKGVDYHQLTDDAVKAADEAKKAADEAKKAADAASDDKAKAKVAADTAKAAKAAQAAADAAKAAEPLRITSLLEYELYFGKTESEAEIVVTIEETLNEKNIVTERNVSGKNDTPSPHNMYYALQAYFANGGGPCYVASVGKIKDSGGIVSLENLQAGIAKVEKIDEVTLFVFPESQALSNENKAGLFDAAIQQCLKLQDRFAIFDLQPPTKVQTILDVAGEFRDLSLNLDALKYSAVYTPNVETIFNYEYEPASVKLVHSQTLSDGSKQNGSFNDKKMSDLAPQQDDKAAGNAILFNLVKAAIEAIPLILPPSPLVAGQYAFVDRTRGVFKAPANVALSSVIKPTIKITSAEQEDLNVHSTGKSINAIRAFTGKGTLIWGSRTLDGNSNEWRYVPVRRFFNMAEESIKKATEGFVFEPNDANTWVKVKAMIENFLTLQWRAGALAGAKPEQAFYVKVGLNETMTALDILEGRLIVEIGMAVVRPAEFIILKFSHKMQES
ncbi:phage tail sheath family protein [Calothrix sp. 336/3]|uniref:phage tail sheath family protein n=1 Tax=Calothrix sp. 336/3 TaxID=1337936 RepID=UPI0004E354EE|nr:phage tail sheath C-terminal domain-containing protein [Calothrix sp. 336/3]AKG21584.1 phage tail sheath protein [Calothrix sp. 336/3]